MSDTGWTFSSHRDAPDIHQGRSVIATGITATVGADPHVAISRDVARDRRALHIGVYETSNVTLYLSDAALTVIRDTIDQHLHAVDPAIAGTT